MTKKRKKQQELDSSNISNVSSGTSVEELSIKSLADNIAIILATVKDNSTALQGLTDSMKTVENRLLEVEKSVTDSNKEISELKPRISAIEDEASNLKVQISVLANENVRLTNKLSAVNHNLQRVESKETRKNVILWNVSASDMESAKNVFEKVVKDGLEYEQNCDFSVLEYGKEKKFIKIEMHSIETRLALLKNAKKLNRKVVMNFC
jgi:chromosome segregation ATPase